jgi:hypothetical protein
LSQASVATRWAVISSQGMYKPHQIEQEMVKIP